MMVTTFFFKKNNNFIVDGNKNYCRDTSIPVGLSVQVVSSTNSNDKMKEKKNKNHNSKNSNETTTVMITIIKNKNMRSGEKISTKKHRRPFNEIQKLPRKKCSKNLFISCQSFRLTLSS